MKAPPKTVPADSLGYFGKTLLLALALFLTACHPKPPKPQIEPYIIVIPKECVTSDLKCTLTKRSKKMDCKFDKIQQCEHIEALPKEKAQ